MPAQPRVINFNLDKAGRPYSDKQGRPITSSNPKKIRERLRGAHKHLVNLEEIDKLYKPVAEWDAEELARGRPRNRAGTFAGVRPLPMVSRAHHEDIISRFRSVVKVEMNTHTVDALRVLGEVLTNEETDTRGRYLVPPATKVTIAMFLLEHVVGKPTQKIEADINIKMQQLLGAVMVMPSAVQAPEDQDPEKFDAYPDFEPNPQLQLTQGYIDVDAREPDV